jgi:hypothetical protein
MTASKTLFQMASLDSFSRALDGSDRATGRPCNAVVRWTAGLDVGITEM